MKVSLWKSLFAFVCIFSALLLVACTSDLSPEAIAPDGFTYSQDEYDSLVASGKMDTTGHVVKSSNSKKQSSSSTTASSSSGTEGSSSSGTPSSSSEDDDWIESSSSAEPESSSAYEATFGENKSIVAKEGVLSIGVDAFADVDD